MDSVITEADCKPRLDSSFSVDNEVLYADGKEEIWLVFTHRHGHDRGSHGLEPFSSSLGEPSEKHANFCH